MLLALLPPFAAFKCLTALVLGHEMQYQRQLDAGECVARLRAAAEALQRDEGLQTESWLPLERWLRTMFLQDFSLRNALFLWYCYLLRPNGTLLVLGGRLARAMHSHGAPEAACSEVMRLNADQLLHGLAAQLAAGDYPSGLLPPDATA